jgi:hypothetical protein
MMPKVYPNQIARFIDVAWAFIGIASIANIAIAVYIIGGAK